MIPMHFMTHEVLLFFTGLWTTNIHDCLHAKIMPIMGAGYHTIHHTTYKHNYGHYTIYFDYLYDTLTHPEDFEGIKKLEETVSPKQHGSDPIRTVIEAPVASLGCPVGVPPTARPWVR